MVDMSDFFSDAPHISHVDIDGWFANVHRGHPTVEDCDGSSRALELIFPVEESATPGGNGRSLVPRLAAADIAAFRMVVKGGLIPHARQGGTGVEEVAATGSKFEGTGLENVHIGHIHVAADDGPGEGPWEGIRRWPAVGDWAGDGNPVVCFRAGLISVL